MYSLIHEISKTWTRWEKNYIQMTDSLHSFDGLPRDHTQPTPYCVFSVILMFDICTLCILHVFLCGKF